ncbi:TPA: glycogen/starch/alpha-glucan family phosphorylase [Streptococcus suis]|nr:glycogen/starch/alpha-glucan family phosphorylase [Streptococcus suis]HEL1777047.1 glycogen/starch/alpha-glucan family phosphorylase [Streptococcus suis]
MINLQNFVQSMYAKRIEDCTDQELYYALLAFTKQQSVAKYTNDQKKKVYYISAEFLIGKLLSNNLINLGVYDEVKSQLVAAGKDLIAIEDMELEPSLGNGGLGRLAACFLDSIASLGLNGDGVGLNYHFGLFRQLFEYHQQSAVPNEWITPRSWLTESPISYQVPFANFTLTSKLYDIDVPGYKTERKNRLRLFDLGSVDDNIIYDGIEFDKEDIFRNLTLFLYPDDSTDEGKVLRIFQQYFMVSNAAQLLIDEAIAKGSNLHDLPDYAVVQINDTHPSLVIPELIRLLELRGISFDEAVEIVKKMTAYTNHTILSEALEKWPLDFLNRVVPHLVPFIVELDRRAKEVKDDPAVNIIDEHGRVHMAHMDIHYGYSINGVAALHTEILKTSELKAFYELYPEKFNNKTNGITFRRWLMHANPSLASYLDGLLGHGYHHDASELEKLLEYKNDKELKSWLDKNKQHNKRKLQRHIAKTQGVEVNPESIFDVQIKRMHEYKRQQMNVLYVIHKYLDIKAGNIPARPLTVFFGGKAAPAYTTAQDIIHLILVLSQVIKNDPEVAPHLQLVMIENYNVTEASFIIPAADISEQISLASKEASGTGNMKFMLNGALTIGTDDGANVEIHELVGDENIYIFGQDSQTVIDHYANGSYHPYSFYERAAIRPLIDFITSDTIRQAGGIDERLWRLQDNLKHNDHFMTLLDLEDYIETKERMLADYEDRDSWLDKVIVNIAKAGFFSSDRTIQQYNEDIWHLEAK